MNPRPLESSTPGSFVSLGRLFFRDFLLLEPLTIRRVVADPEASSDLPVALSNQPDILLRFRRAAIGPIGPIGPIDRAAIDAAQERLVRRFAFELLREKAPALWDTLPCYDWDSSVVLRRFKPWKTKFLVAGETSSSCLSLLDRTAGITIIEPLAIIRRYLERKAELDRLKRVRVLDADIDRIPLPDRAADLAVVGPTLGDDPEAGLSELTRVSSAVLLLDLRPGGSVPPDDWLKEHGFAPGHVHVRALKADRPCWWKQPGC